MKHGVPKTIYLQICEDPDCKIPYADHDGITWCDHKINKTDVKYVLAKPQRQWVGLTDEELELINDCGDTDSYKFAKAIEAKLKEKNDYTKGQA